MLPRPVTMFDSVTVQDIPRDAKAVAGYVNGRYRTFPALEEGWPAAHRLPISVFARNANGTAVVAACLDVEPRDATPQDAVFWVRAQLARDRKLPCVYVQLSSAARLEDELAAAGVKRARYRLWTAHYTGEPHRCGPGCGFGFTGHADATQYTSRAAGRNLDASLCASWFFSRPLSAAAQRRLLRAWILARRAHGWTWARLKATRQWRLFRSLGGR